MRPLLLDLFCGAGGASYGYHQAGFRVIGVDIKPQPNYPFTFVQTNWDDMPLAGFDAIHASPPCQAYSQTRYTHSKEHPDLIAEVRERLVESGLPYVIENVPGAPLLEPTLLCGSMFNLRANDLGLPLYLKRHRLFESNVSLEAPCECRCAEMRAKKIRAGGVYGGGGVRVAPECVKTRGYAPPIHVRCELMGVDWMTYDELSQAIPPVYTKEIGSQLLDQMR